MNKQPKRLGRGLEALLGRAAEAVAEAGPRPNAAIETQFLADPAPRDAADSPVTIPMPGVTRHSEASIPSPAEPAEAERAEPWSRIPVDAIDSNPYQPRVDFDEDDIRSLAETMKEHGLLQPIVVRRHEGRYQLVAGERRLRAARMAGWTDLPANVIEADDRELAELAIVENLQRKDLNPLEKAASFQRYLEEYRATQDELARRLQIDRSTVANLIRLLELPDFVQQALRDGRISQGHARALLPLGEEREQVGFCRKIEAEGWTVRHTETAVQEHVRQAESAGQPAAPKPGRPPKLQSKHLATLEHEFRTALGTKVSISHNARGKGRIVIQFDSHEEFDRLRRWICNLQQTEVA